MTTITLLAREFPDFDQATLPAIPEGFESTAWHNEALPTWHEGQSGDEPKRGMLMLCVDFADPQMRAFPDADTKRFGLQIYWGDDQPQPLVDSDDWAVIQAWVRLVRLIRTKLGLGFHPDTRGADYVDEGGPLGPRSLTDAEAAQYDADVRTACDVGDIYQTSLNVWAALGLITEAEAGR